MSYNGTGVLHVGKKSCVEREADIQLGKIIMISVLSSLSFTFLSVIHSFKIMIGVKSHRVSEARKATWSNCVLEFGIVERQRDSVLNEKKSMTQHRSLWKTAGYLCWNRCKRVNRSSLNSTRNI